MKTLRAHLDEYLNLRHKLGFKFLTAGRLLGGFVAFAEGKKASFITRKLALAWATQPAGCQPAHWATRLGMVRRFAQHVSGSDARTEVPPQELLPHRFHRKAPYLYSDSEVRDLINAVRQLPSPDDLRAISHATLFGLLAVTGMRVGEAIALDRKDVDLERGLITVRRSKFNKSRWVPIHASTQKRLRAYARQRDKLYPHPHTPSFFISERGTRLTDCTVRRWFIIVSHRIGLRKPADRRGPRLHDLRHRFAYKTILNWYRRDVDVEVHLPELTTYLGHGHVADTYWYISSTPALLRLATQRLERRKGGSHER